MKKTLFSLLLLGAGLCSAGETPVTPAPQPAPAAKPFSGSITLGYMTNIERRGVVATHAAGEGDSVEFAAAKYAYDFGAPDKWIFEGTVSYVIPSSGHNMYGRAQFGPTFQAMGYFGPVKIANLENELMLKNGFRYKQEKWNVGFGQMFLHGGPFGAVAKHFRKQGASTINEVYINPEFTPYKWLDMGVTTSYSFQGVTGWWFEPYIRAKAPIIGTPDNVKLAATAELGMTATADYFNSAYNACSNGSQAFFLRLKTPWFVNEHFVLTPGVGFHWLGKGGMKANTKSEMRIYTQNSTMVPFRNFAVVGSVTATYMF